jgi:hypothetical protein
MDVVSLVVVPLVFGGLMLCACCCGCKDDDGDESQV